jgi:D-alanine-D-alanine ligase-like ATP-grasp enzyme
MWNQKYLRVLSPYGTHNHFRRMRLRVPKPTVIRFGSRTEINPRYIEINSIEAINNTRDKLATKKIMKEIGSKTPKYWLINELPDAYPVLLKPRFGMKGRGIVFVENEDNLKRELNKINNKASYFIEKYTTFSKEYRLHMSITSKCFFTMRKMKKIDKVEDKIITDGNSVWLYSDHENFDKPRNWDNIVEDCYNLLKAAKLHFGAFDVKVAKDGSWNILEINSAPGIDGKTIQAYEKELVNLVNYVIK